MPSLAELQSEFRRFIIGDGPPGPGLTGVSGDGLDPAALLSIYRNNTVISLTEALATTFPVVVRLVDRVFDFAADSFIKDNLPTSRSYPSMARTFPRSCRPSPRLPGCPIFPRWPSSNGSSAGHASPSRCRQFGIGTPRNRGIRLRAYRLPHRSDDRIFCLPLPGR